MVRLFKKALYAALKQEQRKAKNPSKEVFRTLLNSRPFASPSQDPDDYLPVTSHDFREIVALPLNPCLVLTFLLQNPEKDFRYLQHIKKFFCDLLVGPIYSHLPLESVSGEPASETGKRFCC